MFTHTFRAGKFSVLPRPTFPALAGLKFLLVFSLLFIQAWSGIFGQVKTYEEGTFLKACRNEKTGEIKKLLRRGAKVNEQDSAGWTALMIAAVQQKPRIARILLKNGASLNQRNNEGYTAKNLAVQSGNRAMAQFLQHYFENHLPDYTDGPYLFFPNRKYVQMTYLKHDSLKNRTFRTDTYHPGKILRGKINGFGADTFTYPVQKNFPFEPSVYHGIKNMVIVGDIHGQCDTLKKFLIANKITDSHLKWNFGEGHLIFLGDVFDRGDEVTDALWLIYRLEYEARNAGGQVHLLLGNHELMELTGDCRYLSDKYRLMFKHLNLNYQTFYSKKSVLGNWIRTKNAIEIINDIILIHGGLHRNILTLGLSIDSINQAMHRILNERHRRNQPANMVSGFLESEDGPLWYRGLIPQNGKATSEAEIDSLLDFFDVKVIVVGHTTLPRVSSFYHGKVYGLDVPFYTIPGSPMEALRIDCWGYYLLNSSGKETRLKKTPPVAP